MLFVVCSQLVDSVYDQYSKCVSTSEIKQKRCYLVLILQVFFHIQV